MFSVRNSTVRQDFELGRVFSKGTKSWACVGVKAMFSVRQSRVRQDFELGMVFSKETKSWACFWVGQCFQ